jgi:modulator of FtsH protease HflK
MAPMNVRSRTALVTLLLNTVLTVLKFVAFAFTGSLAILAEAWHSFGDIATSAAALLSVRRQAHLEQTAELAPMPPPVTPLGVDSSVTLESPSPELAAADTVDMPLDSGEWDRDSMEVPEWPGATGDPDDEFEEILDGGAESPEADRDAHRPLPDSRWRRAFGRPPLSWLAAAGRAVARFSNAVWSLKPEQKAALVIGLFLAGIGIALLRKVVGAEPTVVERPLVAGIGFLVFSLASYAVSRVELGVGAAEGSAALTADGMHARADAVATLLTGVSLILYWFGFNIDRLMAGVLGLIILSFAAETLVNLLVGVLRREERYVLHHRTTDVLGALVEPSVLMAAWARLRARMDRGGALLQGLSRVLRSLPYAVAAVALLLYASTAVFAVPPESEAVVEHFGRVAKPASPSQPGLHLKWPWPIDRVERIDSQRIRDLSAGNRTRDASVPMIWTRQHGTDEVFVSGDNNFFYPYLVVQYRVADVYDYRYSVAEPDRMLENLILQTMTDVFARRSFYGAALEERDSLGQLIWTECQAELDGMDTGIEIVDLVVKDVHPPRDVARSFESVVAAMQDHRTVVNQAEGYRNQKIPEARADAVRRLAEAHAYVAENKTRSEGDASRFTARREAYARGRAVTRQRMYLEAMVRALAGRRKVIISPAAGQPDLWLDETVAPPPRKKRSKGDDDEGSKKRSSRARN